MLSWENNRASSKMLKRLKPTMLLPVNGLVQCNVLKANICESEFCIGKKNRCVRYECENFKLCLSYINWDCWCFSKKKKKFLRSICN